MNLRLERSLAIHDRLTEAAVKGRGMLGVAETVYALTGYPVVIEDSLGNLLASVGSRQPRPEEEEHDRLGELRATGPQPPSASPSWGHVSAGVGAARGRRQRCSHW